MKKADIEVGVWYYFSSGFIWGAVKYASIEDINNDIAEYVLWSNKPQQTNVKLRHLALLRISTEDINYLKDKEATRQAIAEACLKAC